MITSSPFLSLSMKNMNRYSIEQFGEMKIGLSGGELLRQMRHQLINTK